MTGLSLLPFLTALLSLSRLVIATTYSVCSDATADGYGGTIQSHDSYPSYYSLGLTCSMTISTQSSYDRIYLKFTVIDLYDTRAVFCYGSDYIMVIAAAKILCGSDDVGNIEIPANVSSVTISFVTTTGHSQTFTGFKAVFALYYIPDGDCNDVDFACSNGRCIYGGLRCDGTDHCGDNSDEEGCPSSVTLDTAAIAGIAAGGAVLFLIIIIACCCCCCKKKSSPVEPSPTKTNVADTSTRTVPTAATGPVDPGKEFVTFENTRNTQVKSQEQGQGGYGQYYDPLADP